MKGLFAAALVLAQAVSVELSDSEEARAQALMREIRCVACENEPISQSAAQVAENMRLRVRTMIAEGASDKEVRDWFADRYGEFVLFRPQTRGALDWLLWLGPFAFLAAGGALGFGLMRNKAEGAAAEPVAPEDLQDL